MSFYIFEVTKARSWSKCVFARPKNQGYELQNTVVAHSVNNNVPSES